MEREYEPDLVYDAGPTGCGELIMNLFLTMKKMEQGQIIKVISYDPGAREDLPAWAECRSMSFWNAGILARQVIILLKKAEPLVFYI